MKTCIITLVAILFFVETTKASPAINRNIKFDQTLATIEVVDTFEADNPELNAIPQDDPRDVRQQLIYTVGNRQPGDRLVSTTADSKSWPTLQDVTLTLSYPQSGVGAIVTFVQIVVNQSSNQGKGFVVAGGIGQRFIHLMVEAKSTLFFNYSAQIYGL